MSLFDKILVLSKQVASSLLRKKEPTELNDSEIFSDEDKDYILKNLTQKSQIKERQDQGRLINVHSDLEKVNRRIGVPVRRLYKRYMAAAIALVLLSLGYFLKDSYMFDSIKKGGNTTVVEVKDAIETGTDKAVLTLEDGSSVSLEKGEAFQKDNVNSNGEELVYNTSNSKKTEIKYNYLTIPRGGQFSLKLTDGTKVWLNSESQLKYPIAFIDGADRKVELVYGEAYFDVSPSTEHNGAKFIVQNKDQEVEVLGTEFNIKAYKDETNTYTTLVEGKIEVVYDGKKKLLSPHQQSNLDVDTKILEVATVDVYNETAWKEGVFSFEDRSLKEIMRVLSRWYDMEVVFENKEVENVAFNGILDKKQNIEEILTIIKNFKIIEAYEVKGKTVLLK